MHWATFVDDQNFIGYMKHNFEGNRLVALKFTCKSIHYFVDVILSRKV